MITTRLAALINPSKSEIGRVSKLILDRINTKVIEATRINQWKNTKSVLSWFNQVADKSQYSFIAFDVVDFYPSISIDLLKPALDFASKYDNITDTEREIILHVKKSCLYNSGKHWGKKLSSKLFDVTMHSKNKLVKMTNLNWLQPILIGYFNQLKNWLVGHDQLNIGHFDQYIIG